MLYILYFSHLPWSTLNLLTLNKTTNMQLKEVVLVSHKYSCQLHQQGNTRTFCSNFSMVLQSCIQPRVKTERIRKDNCQTVSDLDSK
jgi:hypothetical protein